MKEQETLQICTDCQGSGLRIVKGNSYVCLLCDGTGESWISPEPKGMIVTIKFEAHPGDWKPSPFPGTDEATCKGCLCPAKQPWPMGLDFDSDCPIHELEKSE